ncbi:MAG: nucleoside deaminase [Calditrichaeota bacterium]|nr:MAG: nucleoside deaminase [Calditrichota bacterium]
MNKDDQLFLRRAIALAEQYSADGRHGPFGAVIELDGEIIAEGWNRVVADHDPTAHAEITAIRAACAGRERFDLKGCTIYCSCEPCPMCYAAIFWARLERIVYAADRRDAGNAGFDDDQLYREFLLQPTIQSERLLPEEGRRAFRRWMENPDKVLY